MRKVLIIFLIIILLAILGIMAISGIPLGKSFSIQPIKGIIQADNNLDAKIAELQNTIDTDYKNAQYNLDTSFKNLQDSKQKYQDTITYSTEEEIKAANQTEKYKISYLWTTIGLYATKNNVIMQATVSNGSLSGQYNISFTATGEYIPIQEFIYAIENDSKLGFRIEEFTLQEYAEEQLQATFIIKNISIDEESLNAAIASQAANSIPDTTEGNVINDLTTVPVEQSTLTNN